MSVQNCPTCKTALRFYDGYLGYEALRCDGCGYELDLNAEANAKATAEREKQERARQRAQFADHAYAASETEPRGVYLIAAGYEWECPDCKRLNREIETSETVTCDCGQAFDVFATEHAYG